tara:strand:+ start:306 stop:644 length:339 start_codon:yes stop_codon:yes gene_type:complete
MAELKDLIGQTMASVENLGDSELLFTTTDGKRFRLHHSQVCCESVSIESVVGDLADLVGEPKREWVTYSPVTVTYDTPDGTSVAAELVDNAQCLADVLHISLIRGQQRKEAV